MGSIHFLIHCFCSDFRSSDYIHKPFKGSFCCCSLQFYSFPGCILHWVSKSGVLEVHLSYAGSRGLGCLNVELESLTPQGDDPYLCDPSCWWIAVSRVFPWWAHLLPISMLSFCLWVWKLCSPTFQVYFHGKFSTYSFSFVVFVGGSKFRIFLYHHLELSPWCFPFLLLIFLLWFTWLHFPCDGSNDRGELWISSSPKSKLIRNSLYNLQRKILMMILICLVCLTFPLLCPLFHFLEWNVVL